MDKREVENRGACADGPEARGGEEAGSNPMASEFECSICCDLLLDPVVGNCGHDFCKHCYEQWFRVGKTCRCPICRKPLPGDLGVCVRLKNMIENLFPQRVRERQRQVEATAAEECSKKPRTTPLSLSEVLAAQMPGGVPVAIDSALSMERTIGLGSREAHRIRLQPAEDVLPHVTLYLERLPARQYASLAPTGAPSPAGLIPVQVERPTTPPSSSQTQPALRHPPQTPAAGIQGEPRAPGTSPLTAVPTPAVLSVPAAITVPHWFGTLGTAGGAGPRPGLTPTLRHILTPALVLSPGASVGQLCPLRWGPALEGVALTMGWFQRAAQSRRRLVRRRVRAQNV